MEKITYLGSKAASGAYQAIIAHMPPHDTYIESHLGSGAVMFHKPRAVKNIGIDVDDLALALTRSRWHPESVPRIDFKQCDAVGFLERFDYKNHGRVFVYSDPPYLAETRSSRARYKNEYTLSDHKRLIATLKKIPASVMISGYPSLLYDELLSDWRTYEFTVMTRGGVRTEKIWMNYPGGEVYSAAFAGKNYIDRQRIKRKAERWAKKYQALPPAERMAILAKLLSEESKNDNSN